MKKRNKALINQDYMQTYQWIGLLFAVTGGISFVTLMAEYFQKGTFELSKLNISPTLLTVSRILIGVLFIYSGFVKANDYIGFGYKLTEYFEVFGTLFMRPLAVYLACFISVFEIALGVALIVGYKMRISVVLSLLMMIFFTFLTLFSAWTGKVTDCGCFGDALKITPWESFSKDIILTGMLIPLFLTKKYIKSFPNTMIGGILTAATFLIAGAYAIYCHENLPRVDYRAYKVGVDLNKCTTEIGPKGVIKCKDWDEIYREGGDFKVLEGKTLMLVMYDLEKASPKGLKKSKALSEALAGSGINVVGMTSTGRSKTTEIMASYGIDYAISYRDQTMLKTIVRSSPGYVLLNNGVVQAKWHHNNTPSVQEIQNAFK